jgi:uncharacterized C2H2 Zn-finger protein
MKIVFKCPHCGYVFPASKSPDGLVPAHNHDKQPCPGIGMRPRGKHDARPLQKDEPETKRA